MMALQVLFMCSTLEPAKCGVADFILTLATQISARGITCACIAIHDPYVQPSEESQIHRGVYGNIIIIRIPSRFSWRLKKKLIKSQLESLRPEWVSLHYVPYAYNAKGLPFSFLNSLLPLRDLSKWEITAHELWVDPTSSLRHHVLSILQRRIFHRLYLRLRPVVVHVTNQAYQSELSKHSIQSSLLPLFSNILPFQLPVKPKRSVSQWNFILFGAINPDWKPDDLLEQIEIARCVHGIQTCNFVSVGRISDYAAHLWDSLQSLPYPAFRFKRLGLLPAERVSEQLQLADFGICVVPDVLIEKSGSVAAMLRHGLPIIISRLSIGSEMWQQELRRRGHYILLDSSFVQTIVTASKYDPIDQLNDTTLRFLEALQLSQ